MTPEQMQEQIDRSNRIINEYGEVLVANSNDDKLAIRPESKLPYQKEEIKKAIRLVTHVALVRDGKTATEELWALTLSYRNLASFVTDDEARTANNVLDISSSHDLNKMREIITSADFKKYPYTLANVLKESVRLQEEIESHIEKLRSDILRKKNGTSATNITPSKPEGTKSVLGIAIVLAILFWVFLFALLKR